MLLVYSEAISNRLDYVIRVVFERLAPCEYRITDNIGAFRESNDARLNYSSMEISGIPAIIPDKLLFQNTIEVIDLKPGKIGDLPVLFFASDTGILNFDPFAAIFYCISRFEEYLPFRADVHGRFPLSASSSNKYNFYRKAVVHHWALLLKSELLKNYPDLPFKSRMYQFAPTVDVDNAYAYRNKGIFRSAISLAGSLVRNPAEFSERISVLSGHQADPYDNYQFISDLSRKFDVVVIYFMLTSKWSRFDRNISYRSGAFEGLLNDLSTHSEIGIHPSYRSNRSGRLLKGEIEILSGLVNKTITKSRQHFLKLSMPQTYRNLIENGIVDDFSMGYPELAGFRAGIAIPYPFYDLHSEQSTALTIHPFAFMDSTYIYYNKREPEKIKEEISYLLNEIRAIGGTFYLIWHNESLGIKSWRELFKWTFEQSMP